MESRASRVNAIFRPGQDEPTGRRRLPVATRALPLALPLVLCAATIAGGTAHAQSLDNKYWINAAAYFPKIDTNVRVATKTQTEVATDIDFEKDLGLDDNKVLPSVSAGARFGRVIVGVDYFKLNRTGNVNLGRDINFDGETYPLNAAVRSTFDSDIYRVTVGYAIVRKPDLQLGAAIGLHATKFDMGIAAQGRGSNQATAVAARRKDVLAPLPTLGLFGTYRIAPRVDLNARADYLSLKIDQYDGRLLNAQAGVNYSIVKNIALGVIYRYVDYRLGVDKDNWDGRVRYKLHGPAILVQASF
ncbi:hypothetical protein WBP06_26245 [Novosphingobium sp. BL-8H]|uniref:hypothetical protein n=1 Tax=Novosphingobium sp. BL-8H TaxID=3127640 RepID=UPI00375764BF